jgi:hypothetical protein
MVDEIVATKKWYQSKAIIWAVVLILINTYTEVDKVIQVLPNIPPIILTIINLICGGGVIQGRVAADKTIESKLF